MHMVAGPDPRITLVVPCWNAGSHLRPLVESLLAQTETSARLVLVDDGSDDGSAALARECGRGRMEVLVNERRLGLAANWNRCAELVDTRFFALAHMDDVYEPDFAATLADVLDERPAGAAAHCMARGIDSHGAAIDAPQERMKRRAWSGLDRADRATVYRRLLRSNFIAAPGVVWRTAVFREFGGFDPRLRFALDWDASFRALLAGYELIGVPRALVHYRRHDASATAALGGGVERYREEAEVAAAAHARGAAAGLISAATKPSRAALDHLLYDVLLDLEGGRADAARTKLFFARTSLPGGARDPRRACVAAAARCGRFGCAALRAGFELFLALRAPRVHSA